MFLSSIFSLCVDRSGPDPGSQELNCYGFVDARRGTETQDTEICCCCCPILFSSVSCHHHMAPCVCDARVRGQHCRMKSCIHCSIMSHILIIIYLCDLTLKQIRRLAGFLSLSPLPIFLCSSSLSFNFYLQFAFSNQLKFFGCTSSARCLILLQVNRMNTDRALQFTLYWHLNNKKKKSGSDRSKINWTFFTYK